MNVTWVDDSSFSKFDKSFVYVLAMFMIREKRCSKTSNKWKTNIVYNIMRFL